MSCRLVNGVHEWCIPFLFFFFKQKTAYEMRISDWSSDVCSSDLCFASERPTSSGWLLRQRKTDIFRRRVMCVDADRRRLEPAGDSDRAVMIGGPDRRSEERRVGKERVSTCRSRWWPYH